jgi:hypothetical protein
VAEVSTEPIGIISIAKRVAAAGTTIMVAKELRERIVTSAYLSRTAPSGSVQGSQRPFDLISSLSLLTARNNRQPLIRFSPRYSPEVSVRWVITALPTASIGD